MKAKRTNKTQSSQHARLSQLTGNALVLAPFDIEALNNLKLIMRVSYESWTDTQKL